MLEKRGVAGKPGGKKKSLCLKMWDVPNDQKAKVCEVLNVFAETVCVVLIIHHI